VTLLQKGFSHREEAKSTKIFHFESLRLRAFVVKKQALSLSVLAKNPVQKASI